MPDNIQAVVSPQEISTSATTAPSLQIDMELDPTVNFAMQQNDVPIVQSLKITNLTQTEIRNVQVEIRTEPEFAMLWKTQIASLPSAGTYHLGVVDLELSPQHLLELTERVAGIVHVEVKSEQTVLAQTTSRIEILAHDEWSGLRSLPEILAAFVLPNHPDVERILSRAAQILKEWTGNSSLSGYQSKDRKRVLEIVAAIYTAIQSQELTYVNPPSSFEQCGQKIRLPHRIFENKMGTCLDLAVLCAACVEQAGLFPLLVLTNGHAFTGAWLEEECFQDSASDDGLRLKKRIDLEEICVFETTLLTGSASLNFECAMQEGNRQLDDLDAFRCVLDIQRCRKSRIRPLPIRVSGTSIEIVSTPPSTESVIPQEAIAPDFSGFGKAQQADLLNNTSGQITETPATRLDKWKRNLLDLTMRNRLLNFRESHKTLPILCPDLYSLEDSLADGEAFKILERPAEMSAGQPRSQELHFQRTGQDALTELIKAEFSAKRLRADVTENELNRRLLEIHREARNSLEEGGANTLFLALGFLSWYETSDSQQARIAPIILIPIELKRRSMLEGFRICLGDEESRINTTLLELLVQEFELRVPLSDPLPTDEHGIDVQGILNTFKHAVKNIDRWEVLEKAQIGLFSFTKYLMWRDLEVRAGDLARNKVVSHLINRSNKAFVNEGELPQVEHLDHTYKPENTFCPLSSDSSQLVAIHAAAEGKSFVLQGPPGTGKSQTITNLIAHCLATGKTVLFVSEKMAALNVVHSRLKKIGLTPFCLELHSNKSHKLEVIQQLGQSLEQLNRHSPEAWLEEANRLSAVRKELNSYVQALHKKRASGESVFQGTSRLIGLRNMPSVELGWSDALDIDRETLERKRETLKRLRVAAEACEHPARNVWKTTDYQEWSPALEREVLALLTQVKNCGESLSQALRIASPFLGFDAFDGTFEKHEITAQVVSVLLKALPDLPPSFLTASDWNALETSMQEVVRLGKQRDALQSTLSLHFTERILDLELNDIQKKASTAFSSWLSQNTLNHLQKNRNDQAEWIDWLENEGQKLFDLFKSCCGFLLEKSQPVATLLSIAPGDWALATYSYLDELVTTLLDMPPVFPTALLNVSDWEKMRYQIQEAVEHGRKYNALRDSLYERYTDQVLQLDLESARQKLASANASWFLPRLLGQLSVKKILKPVTRLGQLPAPESMLHDLEQALALRNEGQCLEATDEWVRNALGVHWKKWDTDWVLVERILTWCTTLRNLAAQATGTDAEKAANLRGKWAKMLEEGRDRLRADGDLRRLLDEMQKAFRAFTDCKQTIEIQLQQSPETLWKNAKQPGILGRMQDSINEWKSQIAALCKIRETAIQTLTAEDISAGIECAISLKAVEASLESLSMLAKKTLGAIWKDEKTEWGRIELALEQTRQLRGFAEKLGNAETICSTWANLAMRFAQEGEIKQPLLQVKNAYADFKNNLPSLEEKLSLAADSDWQNIQQSEWLKGTQMRINRWIDQMLGFRPWCYWRSIRAQALAEDLQVFVSVYEEESIVPCQFVDVFDRNYYQWWIEREVQADAILRGFFSPEFERKIQQFREIDERYTQLASLEVQARLSAKTPVVSDAASSNSEMGILRHQIQRKRGHKPVRQLFQEIPNLLPRLKPCLLMSPISVAQYLDAGYSQFDLVVFDEASQIPVWDAVGAIARGNEVIIVGDPKQLPPTNFFNRADGQGQVDDDGIEDLESILDDCLAAQIPDLKLNWHYRSRHESLIAFSNYHYYDNNLLTFPSPHRDMGVSFHSISGVYDKGKSQTNRAEADAVVAEIVRRLTTPGLSCHSIGVVTFSMAQQRLIEDLLETAQREHPEIEEFFSSETTQEPVFIKNLENVQGDERDVILFSICYGPDATGRVSMNFGPLNRAGGERRLNVAITRARREVLVFSTLKSEHIDLARTRARGVRDLKDFLDYAERGATAIAEARITQSGDDFDSPFEKQVCDMLRQKGYTVHSQVGCSGYRVDLAIVDPQAPGRYLLGIECDGANYHRARTARDRDRLRESILRDLGWELHRIWSTDWWNNPQQELDRIEVAIEKAKKNIASAAAKKVLIVPQIAGRDNQVRDEERLIASQCLVEKRTAKLNASSSRPYLVYSSTILGSSEGFYDTLRAAQIIATIDDVVSVEGPISLNLLTRRVAACWDLKKVNKNVLTRTDALSQHCNANRVQHDSDVFFWSKDTSPQTYAIFRMPGDDATSKRDADDIPPEEVANAALQVLEQSISLPLADLIRETARLFGFQRTGPVVEKSMQRGIHFLTQCGAAVEQDGMITHMP